MLRRLFDLLLDRRAARILRRLDEHLRPRGVLIDIGSGTGHNARAIRRSRPELKIVELDVVPLTPPGGTAPLKIIDGKLPLPNGWADCGVMLYVLHYVDDLDALLGEAARVIRHRLILVQTTADDRAARAWWRVRDAFLGRVPFYVCRAFRLIEGGPCSMHPVRLLDRPTLLAAAGRAGWRCVHVTEERGIVTTLSRDLIVLERDGAPPGGDFG